ncbi:MAG: N-formylglutamate amidohydrolase [Kordiimonadaceae bacterium]|jgi:predicted N-formylglutamate amidohydrolase|nr:N-formylglutamate amidohydrolase [Kordiimonadaceae bacterium]MBT6032310.1 N-formylglutamate amidohydrolase [Kordiimonadaceae bacterium]
MAFDIINPTGSANIVLICEHASNHIPIEYEKLGLSDQQLKLHIAWDIGIAEVTKNLAISLGAPAILARFSRLLIDANRALNQDGLIPTHSDGHFIPKNSNLSKDDIKKRIDQFYTPFHHAAGELIKKKTHHQEAPLIFNMHSFTPFMNDKERPWHTGMLWNKDPRIANALLNGLTKRGYHVGDNQPYTGLELNHTMNTHGTEHGFPHVNIEIRQNEIDTPQGINKWSDILHEELGLIRKMPEMALIKHY